MPFGEHCLYLCLYLNSCQTDAELIAKGTDDSLIGHRCGH